MNINGFNLPPHLHFQNFLFDLKQPHETLRMIWVWCYCLKKNQYFGAILFSNPRSFMLHSIRVPFDLGLLVHPMYAMQGTRSLLFKEGESWNVVGSTSGRAFICIYKWMKIIKVGPEWEKAPHSQLGWQLSVLRPGENSNV